MLKTMRENMPLVMWTLVFAFVATIVFSWGMGGFEDTTQLDGVVGQVGGVDIMYDRYNRLVQDKLAQERSKKPDQELTDTQIKQVRQQVWEDIVRDETMKHYQAKWNIVTTDEEVAQAVRNNPPDFIKNNDNFKKDGKFDPQLYQEFLANPDAAEILIDIESQYRASIGSQKVIDRVLQPVFTSEAEAWEDFLATNRKFKGVVASFPITAYTVDSTSISSVEIEKYYSEHVNDYQQKERRKLAYVTIPLTMGAADTQRVNETVEDVLAMLKQGDSFESLAKEYSEDPGSGANGGALGWFGRGRMVAEFDSTCFNTEIGQVVGPVMTRFGAHIIRVDERSINGTQDSVRASHILVKYGIGPDTESRISQKAKDFSDAASADGFEAAAAQFNLTVETTALFPFNETGSIPGIGTLRSIADFAFNSKIGKISYVTKTKIKGQDGYSVFQVVGEAAAGVQPLSEVESAVRSALVKKRQRDLALQAATAFRARVSAADQLVPLAQAESVKIDSTGPNGRREFIKGLGTDEENARKILALTPGSVSQPLSNTRGAYVVAVLEIAEADSALYQTSHDQLMTNLERTKQNRVYSDWLKQAKTDLGVEDKRFLYYSDF
jgi:peptidyl-prolyl cis-trans isomerase D